MKRMPRAWVHSGVVSAEGILIARALSLLEAQKRVMSLWMEGCQLLDCNGRWILQFPSPRRTSCELSLGSPLVRQGALLSSLPLAEDELETICEGEGIVLRATSASHVLWCDEGTFVCIPTLALTRIDPATWFDVRALEVESALPLAAPASPVEVLETVEAVDLRSRIGIGSPSSEQTSLQAALRGESGTSTPTLLARFKDWFSQEKGRSQQKDQQHETRRAGVWSRFQAWRARDSSDSTEMITSRQRAPGLFQKAQAWWRTRVMSSRLGRVLGRRQGKYLSKVLDLFESGNLDEAMRHAIPLSGDLSEVAPTMRLPGRRSNLRISMGGNASAASMQLEEDFFTTLRRQYRRALEQLLRDDKIDEALFVLLELLKENEEGIALLEKHRRYEMAAQVAESRDMLPERIVRQWLLAGDGERALHIARRHHAFAPAIRMLESSHPEEASRLRLWWADWAASSGDYVTAVDAVWRVAPKLAATWIDRGIALGGVTAARLVVRKVEIGGCAASTDALPIVRGILQDSTREGREARLVLGQALVDARDQQALSGFARGLIRALVLDHNGDKRVADMIKRLGKQYAPVEVADLPVLAKYPRRPKNEEAAHYNVAPSDIGALRVFDACLLPRGEILVALGDVGCALLRKDGSWRHHFRFPTEQLIISDNGAHAIGVYPREASFQLSKFNLETRREAHWIDIVMQSDLEPPMRPFPPSYDGALLPCTDGESVSIYDVQEDRAVVLWRVGDLGMHVTCVSRNTEWLHILGRHPITTSEGEHSWERFSYALPSLRLHERERLESDPHEELILDCNVAPNGEAYVSYFQKEPVVFETSLWRGLGNNTYHGGFDKPSDHKVVATAIASGEEALIATDPQMPGKAKIWHQHAFTTSVQLGGATEVAGRVQRIEGSKRDVAILFDDRGRILWFDSESAELIGNIRIRA